LNDVFFSTFFLLDQNVKASPAEEKTFSLMHYVENWGQAGQNGECGET